MTKYGSTTVGSLSSVVSATTPVAYPTDFSASFTDSSAIRLSFITSMKNSYTSSVLYTAQAVYQGNIYTNSGVTSPILIQNLSSATTYTCYIKVTLDDQYTGTSFGLSVNTQGVVSKTVSVAAYGNYSLSFYTNSTTGITYTTYTFKSGTGSLDISKNDTNSVPIYILAVGGGGYGGNGGGSGNYTGGGGGGGVAQLTGTMTFSGKNTITTSVGTGGVPSTFTNPTSTTLTGTAITSIFSVSTVTAYYGGNGGSNSGTGTTGGCGGGGAARTTGYAQANVLNSSYTITSYADTGTQGYRGGGGQTGDGYAGGGGGAGGAGVTAANKGGNGGIGIQCSLTGIDNTPYYGGGGGGGSSVTPGTGGTGGGGSGNGGAATANTGGGGGGGNNNNTTGTGGSGIIIVSIRKDYYITTPPTDYAMLLYVNSTTVPTKDATGVYTITGASVTSSYSQGSRTYNLSNTATTINSFTFTTNSYSICCWVYETTALNNGFWFQSSNSTGALLWNLSYINSMAFSASYNGSGTMNFNSYLSFNNVWAHWVITFDGSTAIFYRNGIKQTSGSMTGSTETSKNWIINQGCTTYFNYLMFYNRVLTTTEVYNIYNAQY